MKYNAFLDGEECTAYKRVEAESIEEAAPELMEEMKELAPDDASFEIKGNRIYIYRDGDYDNYISIEEVEE